MYYQNIPKGIQVIERTRSFTRTPTGSIPDTICPLKLRWGHNYYRNPQILHLNNSSDHTCCSSQKRQGNLASCSSNDKFFQQVFFNNTEPWFHQCAICLMYVDFTKLDMRLSERQEGYHRL